MCQNGLLTTLFLRCFVYPVSVHSGYTLVRHTARHWTTVVGLVPRRAGVTGLEASFATRLPVAGYTRGAVASGTPCTGGCWGVGWVHAPVASVGLWRAGFGVAGCRAPAWSGWLGGCYRRGTAPATGYRHRVTGWWVVSVGPAVFSCFCEAVTRCFAKPFWLYARLSDFR